MTTVEFNKVVITKIIISLYICVKSK